VGLYTGNIISFCSGVGGLDLGVRLASPGARTICYVEREIACCEILATRMQEASLDLAPLWTNARTFDGRPWRGLVDGIIGGIPCQPHSLAGSRRGSDDERDLWDDFKRVLLECEATWALIENVYGFLVPSKSKGLPAAIVRVLQELSEIGWDAEWVTLRASDVGAAHQRRRVFVLARKRNVAHVTGNGRRKDVAPTPRGRSDAFINNNNMDNPQGHDRRGELEQSSPKSGRSLSSGTDAALANPSDSRRGLHEGSREPGQGTPLADRAGSGLADAELAGCEGQRTRPHEGWSRSVEGCGELADAELQRGQVQTSRQQPAVQGIDSYCDPPLFAAGPDDPRWSEILEAFPSLEPALCGVVDGLAGRVDRIRACGNGVVPLQAAIALRILAARLEQSLDTRYTLHRK